MKAQRTSSRFEPAIYQDSPDAIAVVHVHDHGRDNLIEVPIGEYFHDKHTSKIILRQDERSRQMLAEAKEILLKSNRKRRASATAKKKQFKRRSPKHESAIVKDEPDPV